MELKVNRDLELDDLGLTDEQLQLIQERAEALFDQNAGHAQEAIKHAGKICSKI